MIKKIDIFQYNDIVEKEPTLGRSTNPLFEDLPQYHFDRDEMCEVFDKEFVEWLWDNMDTSSDCFDIFRRDDEFYILHRNSGTLINWYKHMGRTNTCNKDLSIEDLREFKNLLLLDYLYIDEQGTI